MKDAGNAMMRKEVEKARGKKLIVTRWKRR